MLTEKATIKKIYSLVYICKPKYNTRIETRSLEL